MFVEAKRKLNVDVKDIDFSILPQSIYLAYSIQYKKLAELVKERLGKQVKGFQQVLGCSAIKSKYPILLIGSGRFHALNLALQGNTVYIIEGTEINQVNAPEVEKIKAKRKAALSRFYAADKVGILVSTKPGQENLKKALKLKNQLKDKEVSIFIANNLNLNELENYDVESWVNTACPALTFDSKVVNIQELTN